MKRLFIFSILLVVLFTALDSHAAKKVLPAQSRIYVTPMNNGLDGFIKSEIFKQSLPILITLKEIDSDYVLTGSMVTKESSQKWFHYLTGTAGMSDSAQANISLIRTNDETLVWSTDAGDRSLWWGMLKRKGERKVAQRLVSQLKKTIIK